MKGLFSFLLLFLALNISAIGQNLVVNGSFEDTLDCPNQINQVNFATGWISSGGTPDFFHPCANTTAPNFGIPVNNRGYQQPHDGQAYTGLFTYSVLQANGREFIGGSLTTPLVPGVTYFVSFWVNHADVNVLAWNTNNIGIKFSTNQYVWFSNPDTINNAPHVFSTAVLSDTAAWTQVKGSFVADSAYSFFAIGNYFSDSLTTKVNGGSGTVNYAYYLIDDLCVSTAENCTAVSSIHEMSAEIVVLFPNPFTDEINLELSNDLKDGTILIVNLSGQVVLEMHHVNGRQHSVHGISGLASGIYSIEVQDEDFHAIEKIVKE